MQLHFTGHNIEVTPALKSVTQEKLQRLQRHYENINSIYVIFHTEHVDQVAEATVHLDGIEIHAKAQAHDMYNAIDMLVDKLMVQITKHKEKLIDNHH